MDKEWIKSRQVGGNGQYIRLMLDSFSVLLVLVG
jgi:hypothetical protein